MNLELQQRAVEYNAIFKKHDELRNGLFESMPEFEAKNNLENQNQNLDFNNEETNEESDFIEKTQAITSLDVSLVIFVFL